MHVLTEYKAEEFLEKEGFPVVERKLCHAEKEAFAFAKRYDFHVVLKLSSSHLLHKSDVHAVRLDVDKDSFSKVYKDLASSKLEKEGVLVQPFLSGKHLLLGLKKDPTFGHVLTVALGGVYAELMKDVSFRVLPVSKKECVGMLRELKSFKLLEGFRGEKVNLKLLVTLLLKLAKLAKKYPDIQELDINPLVIGEKKAKVVDARIVFS